ncbi:MAG TPA: ATP-binding protein [Thermomicrobiaceae bacterium]|nr:ATP-binding protein [Thermomicrobiaceae bacterium]
MTPADEAPTVPHAAGVGDVLAGGGELGVLMRAHDWAATPLGPVSGWSHALRTCVRILLTSRQPMWLGWGDELTYLYNDAYRAIAGGKHPLALGKPTREVWHEIWDDISPRIDSALTGLEGTYDEALLLIMERHGYPEETYYTFSYSPVPDDDGRVRGIFCANTDDTRRIIGERQLALLTELASAAARARSLSQAYALSVDALETNLHDLPFALLYVVEPDQDRAVLVGASNIAMRHPAVPAGVPLAGEDPWQIGAALRSRTVRVLRDVPPDLALPTGSWDRPPTQLAVLPIASTGETGRAGALVVGLNPYRLFDDDYERFLSLVAGQIGAAIGNAQAYEEERKRAEALAELDRAKTTFFSNVSHEFRTPLTLMLGPLDDLLAETHEALAPEQRESLEIAHRNGLRLLRLVNSLLDFARIEAGRVAPSYEPVDLARLTVDLASTFRSAVERAGLRLSVDCAAPPPGVETFVDGEMWEKIVLNLLSNAFKHTFAGEIAVSLRAAPDGRSVALAVRDTGVGIPADELPHLFERFHRVQGARARTVEGSGIGLALVQELTRLHGGQVAVESALGQGTSFTVTIPTGAAHLPRERIRADRERASTATGADAFVAEALRWLPEPGDGATRPQDRRDGGLAWGSGLTDLSPTGARILLVDDNADMREYVSRLLGARHRVATAPDGVAALAAALEDPPDLVLTDVMMPRLDGFGLVRALRGDARTREVPIIVLSARAGEDAPLLGLEAGADDYLTKPFSARELLAHVEAHLALSRLRRETAELERALRHAAETEQARMREWLMQAPAAIAILHGPAHEYVSANARYAGMVGDRDVLGKPIREALPELAGQGIFELLDRVFQTGEPHIGRETFVRLREPGSGDLRDTYFDFVYQPIRAADGPVEGIFVHAIDVTDPVLARRQLEREVAERQRAQALLTGQRVVLELIARGAPLTEALEALTRVIEAESSDMLCSVLLLDDDGVHLRHGAAPRLPDAYSRAIDGVAIGPSVGSCGTAAWRGEPVVVRDIATDPLWSDFRDLALAHDLRACWSTPIRGYQRDVLGTIAVYYRTPRLPEPRERRLVDTLSYLAGIAIERRRAEVELTLTLDRERAARTEAEAAVRARDEFLSIAAHELRTPVAAVKGTAEVTLRAQRRGLLDVARTEKALRTIKQTADRLAALTDDLLDVSRLQGGQLALRPQPTDLQAVIRRVTERYADLIETSHVLELELLSTSVTTDADPGRLEQVFDNLFGNALKYSPAGGVIEITLATEPGGVVVGVRDTGIGLPEGMEQRIFEPFGRAPNAASQGIPGMGLGLYISRRIVELHGGRLWAESDGEGRGTTMWVWLPWSASAAAP